MLKKKKNKNKLLQAIKWIQPKYKIVIPPPTILLKVHIDEFMILQDKLKNYSLYLNFVWILACGLLGVIFKWQKEISPSKPKCRKINGEKKKKKDKFQLIIFAPNPTILVILWLLSIEIQMQSKTSDFYIYHCLLLHARWYKC